MGPDDSVQKEEENDDDESKDESMKQPKKNRRVSKLENVKNAKQNKNKQKQLGSEYKSKKSKGDVKLKHQMYEPYAYVPLDSRNYSKKMRDGTVQQMSSVVRNNKRKRG